MRKRRPEGLKFSHPPQPFSLPIFAVWGAFSRLASSSSATFAQRRRDAKAGMGSRARSEEAAAGLSATVDECRVREAGDKPDRSFISRIKIACVFLAKYSKPRRTGRRHRTRPGCVLFARARRLLTMPSDKFSNRSTNFDTMLHFQRWLTHVF